MKDTLRLIRKYGRLGALRWSLVRSQKIFRWWPALNRFFTGAEQRLFRHQQRLEFQQFDAAHGTDTGGKIDLDALTVSGKKSRECLWYEGASPSIFSQIVAGLGVNAGEFDFIDFGSGKGRIVLMAAELGFRKSTGVEFAKELHEIATGNVAIFNARSTKRANIELHHMNAVDFVIPETPLVVFFYCPFTGAVLDAVLKNITASLRLHPRPVHLLFVGQNPAVIAQFDAIGFRFREVRLKRDPTRFIHYRGLIYSSPEAVAAPQNRTVA